MKGKIRLVVLAVIVGVLLGGIVAGATQVSTVTVGRNDSEMIKSLCNTAATSKSISTSNQSAAKAIVTIGYGNNSGIISFHNGTYMKLSLDERKAYMSDVLSGIKASSLGTVSKNKLYNFFYEQDSEVTQALKYLTEDTSADLARARKWFLPFTGGIGTAMGVFSLVVFMFLGVSSLWDVAYLALPGLQLVLERGDDKKRPFGVSTEAWKVNREIANDYNNSKSVISAYLRRRVPVIMVCAVCIVYLVSGKVYEMLGYFANAFTNL